MTTDHKDTPPIWMDRTLRLSGLIKEFLGYYSSFHRTLPPHNTLETSPLLMRHTECNWVHMSTDHKDTPTIWIYSTLRLSGLIKEFLGYYSSFHRTLRPHTHSRDSSTFTEAQRTQPSQFDHRTHTPEWTKHLTALFHFCF